MASVLALVGSAVGYEVDRSRHQAPAPAASAPAVRIYPATQLGLSEPADLTGAGQHLWITNSAGNSVTELGWRHGSRPIIRAGDGYGFLAPGAVTAGRGHLWVANPVADTITELSAADGAVIRTINVATPHSLLLFGNRLWAANPEGNSVILINGGTGSKVRVFRHNGFHYPAALAVSRRLLWVANEAQGTITVMDAVTGAWRATLRGPRYDLRQPVAEVASRSMLWVADAATRKITQISTITRKQVRVIGGPRFRFGTPGPMALAGGSLWVVNTAGNSVTEIDAGTGELIKVFSGPAYGFDNPSGIAAFHHAIWVASASALTRLALPVRGRAKAHS